MLKWLFGVEAPSDAGQSERGDRSSHESGYRIVSHVRTPTASEVSAVGGQRIDGGY